LDTPSYHMYVHSPVPILCHTPALFCPLYSV